MRLLPGFLFSLLAWGWLLPSLLATETLYLKNGDRLSGSQIGMGEGVLRWNWNDAGIVEVPIDEIEKVDYQPDPSTSESDIGSLVLMTPGQVFAPPADHMPLDLPAPTPPPPPFLRTLWHEYRDWFQHGFDTWTERLELGGSFLEGNTNQETFNTAAKFTRETDWTKTQINLTGQYAQSKSALTANRWTADTTTDFKRKDKWITFIRTLHEFDEFANLDYRGTGSMGVGYRFIDSDPRQLIVRAGPGVTQEVFHSPRVLRTTPDLFTEIEAKWPIGQRVIFEEKATVHPSVNDWQLVRILNQTSFLIPLDSLKRWNLKFGFRYEYNGIPNINRRPSDFATTVNIVYSRK
jgi:putative salt-induced outer membrane protein YdiY